MRGASGGRRVHAAPGSRPGSEEVLRQLDALARVTDDLVRIPGLGWRVGIDPIIGLVPGIGDITSALMSFAILVGAAWVGVPRVTLLRMGFNIALDLLVGAIPFVGDAFDVWWRANQRNMSLLRLRAPSADRVARHGTPGDWAFVIGVIVALLAILAGVVLAFAWLISQLARIVIG